MSWSVFAQVHSMKNGKKIKCKCGPQQSPLPNPLNPVEAQVPRQGSMRCATQGVALRGRGSERSARRRSTARPSGALQEQLFKGEAGEGGTHGGLPLPLTRPLLRLVGAQEGGELILDP